MLILSSIRIKRESMILLKKIFWSFLMISLRRYKIIYLMELSSSMMRMNSWLKLFLILIWSLKIKCIRTRIDVFTISLFLLSKRRKSLSDSWLRISGFLNTRSPKKMIEFIWISLFLELSIVWISLSFLLMKYYWLRIIREHLKKWRIVYMSSSLTFFRSFDNWMNMWKTLPSYSKPWLAIF